MLTTTGKAEFIEQKIIINRQEVRSNKSVMDNG
ncbi:hypothetical protein CLJU_c36280 [Clostridium ljungdahlii DSM 13528]|uniref:Uncharacterized protein n=1 Tax=Clostridium ljungdahlii (strain ATCC 55383 / DSM 13528 / PETC) TaxID=748727 RepID=D8GT70_CLOLD|nr:hypothetical protein CLJU_c36280 [Clostridium ljungdahlii DSM 13528]